MMMLAIQLIESKEESLCNGAFRHKAAHFLCDLETAFGDENIHIFLSSFHINFGSS